MTLVRDVLRGKGPQVWTINPGATVYAALELMAERNVGALPVVDRGSLAGIFSERDYARKVVLQGRSSRDTTVEELMTRDVVTIEPGANLEQCMELMTDRRIRHLPVMENGEMIGIVSIGDVLKAVIGEQRTMIRDLENYIVGAPR